MQTYAPLVQSIDSNRSGVRGCNEPVLQDRSSDCCTRRHFGTSVSASLPVEALLTVAQSDSVKKGDSHILERHRNRPLNKGHVKDIVRYLETETKYFGSSDHAELRRKAPSFCLGRCGIRRPWISKPCVAVLPLNHQLSVTDGQHRHGGINRGDRSVVPSIKEQSRKE